MIGIGLVDGQENRGAGGIGDVRVGRNGVAGDDRIAVAEAGVIDIEIWSGGVIGVEGQSQQTLLTVVDHQAADIEERLCQDLPIFDDQDFAILLDHKQAPGAVTGMRDLDGSGKQGIGDRAAESDFKGYGST